MTKAEALEKSIKKHKRIVKGTGVDRGIRNCALCVRYFNEHCEGCPVSEKTGHSGCDSTPYDDWINHMEVAHDRYSHPFKRVPYCQKCMKLTRAEVTFLESLRCKEVQNGVCFC